MGCNKAPQWISKVHVHVLWSINSSWHLTRLCCWDFFLCFFGMGGWGGEGVQVHITHTPPLSVSLSRHDSLSLCLSTSHFCSCDNPLSVCLSVCLSVSVSLSLSLSPHTVEFAMKNHPGGKEKEKIHLGIFSWRLTMPTPKVLCKITSHSGHSKTATTNKQCNWVSTVVQPRNWTPWRRSFQK